MPGRDVGLGRLHGRESFVALRRDGRRVRRGPLTFVVGQQPRAVPCVGFAVQRAVGPAVQRNLVRRRLREILRERADRLPRTDILVRPAPASALLSYAQLTASVEGALPAVLAAGPAPVDPTADPTAGPAAVGQPS